MAVVYALKKFYDPQSPNLPNSSSVLPSNPSSQPANQLPTNQSQSSLPKKDLLQIPRGLGRTLTSPALANSNYRPLPVPTKNSPPSISPSAKISVSSSNDFPIKRKPVLEPIPQLEPIQIEIQ